jgi:cytochrome d ubiquinol oxidase subunit II
LWPAVILLGVLGIPATILARPASLANYRSHPADFLAPLAVVAGLILMRPGLPSRSRLKSFLGSCLFLSSMLVGAALGLFPALLPAVGPGHDLTIADAMSGPHTLRVGLVWWSFGILLAILYFSIVYWLFRGKVSEHAEGYGH